MGLKMPLWDEFSKANKAEYYARGQRSFVYRLNYKGKKAIAKVERADRDAVCRMRNEAKWLRILNKKKIGAKLLLEGADFILIEFVEGTRIVEFAEKAEKEDLRKALLDVMKQCRIMDRMNVSKEEMHNPWKHVIVTPENKALMIDFERCHYDTNPKNVRQFCQFLISKSMREILEAKGIFIEKGKVIAWLKAYKQGKDVYNSILETLSLKP